MADIAAFLVILQPNVHPDQVEDTIAAIRQIKGVAAVHTRFDVKGIAHEILGVHQIIKETQDSITTRARAAGGL